MKNVVDINDKKLKELKRFKDFYEHHIGAAETIASDMINSSGLWKATFVTLDRSLLVECVMAMMMKQAGLKHPLAEYAEQHKEFFV